jgi:excisionase family DNA binding protein
MIDKGRPLAAPILALADGMLPEIRLGSSTPGAVRVRTAGAAGLAQQEGDVERVTMSVPKAGRLLGISRGSAYEAARRGDIPTIRIGKLLRVPKMAFQRMLGGVGQSNTAQI